MTHNGRSRYCRKILPGLMIILWLSSGHLALDRDVVSAEQNSKSEPTTRELIDRLSNAKQASVTADTLIARGKPAVQDLIRAAVKGRKISVRGWAIVCLSEIGGKDAAECLAELSTDRKQQPLVRAWAAAGRVRMTRSLEELLEMDDLISQTPSLNRPVSMKIIKFISAMENTNLADELLRFTLRYPKLKQTLEKSILSLGSQALIESLMSANSPNVRRQAAAYLGTMDTQGNQKVAPEIVSALKFNKKEDTNLANELLRFTLRYPILEQTLGKSILSLGSQALIESLMSANSPNVRRKAAAYLGTMAGQGKQKVAAAIVSALKFKKNAKAVPWSGGPLFLPALDWSKKDAQGLFGNLVAWLLWCDRNKLKDAQGQIRNNLQSFTLSRAAGYKSQGFGTESTTNWLLEWGRTAGKKELLHLLREQGVEREPRYKAVLNKVK